MTLWIGQSSKRASGSHSMWLPLVSIRFDSVFVDVEQQLGRLRLWRWPSEVIDDLESECVKLRNISSLLKRDASEDLCHRCGTVKPYCQSDRCLLMEGIR
jgi:hypothetical protein